MTPWVVPMVVSNSFRVEPERGAIRFWYRPDYSSGVGPGQTATLLALTAINGQTELNWWSLVVTPDGNEVHLVCPTENGPQSCLQIEINWEAGGWYLVTLGFTPTNSALFIDDQLAAVGPGLETVPKELAPYVTLAVGSTAAGTLPAQGQIEELSIFSGRKKMQQIMGNPFGLSVDWEIGTYYNSLSNIAALGPISDEEIAARKARAEQLRAEREALGIEMEGDGMEMMISGPATECVTNSPLYITNTVALFDTNTLWTVQFEIQGTNSPADIFVTTNLVGNYLTNSFWVWLERGPTCYTYQYTNQSPERSFYILGDATVDSDSDGLPDAYEKLVTHTNPQVWNYLDSDGDGLADAWELAHGYDPGRADTNGNGIPDGYEDWDGDALANLMEAGFRSDPAVANATWRQDSDADGIPDSVDDSPSMTDTPPLVTTFEKCPL
ncbi:MAG TPA: LamG-like jellyroll fold domain-containing protein [Verrucomicrobiae bacterium]|nr:LamG-like jellyroll fold domain-containing protein [Verrucomicrobiae bacterium]